MSQLHCNYFTVATSRTGCGVYFPLVWWTLHNKRFFIDNIKFFVKGIFNYVTTLMSIFIFNYISATIEYKGLKKQKSTWSFFQLFLFFCFVLFSKWQSRSMPLGPIVVRVLGDLFFSILSRMRLMVDYHSKPAPGLFLFTSSLRLHCTGCFSDILLCAGGTLILLKTLK